jgi:hypothetical protein
MDAKKAVHKHEKAMHPGKPLTKLAKGGKTNLDMKKYGRNMAKVMNQRKAFGKPMKPASIGG